jgi:peptidoglycan hydrolase CwlO-like protein
MMKRFLVSILVCLIVLFSVTPSVHAATLSSIPSVATSVMLGVEQAQEDVMEQLKEKVLPQIQKILTPEQQEQLEDAIVEGKSSMRKAFKSLTLTPEQKTKLATVFKSLPKKEMFTAMSPDQKRQFFMKKKEFFKPTPEEIAEYKSMKGK